MIKISTIISDAWQNRKGPAIFTTVNTDGMPNSIYVTCISLYKEDTILIANNFFNKTLENILTTTKASILFITHNDTAYQLKGTPIYYTEGEFFNDMKKWNPKKHPGHGVVVFKIVEIYEGAKKLL